MIPKIDFCFSPNELEECLCSFSREDRFVSLDPCGGASAEQNLEIKISKIAESVWTVYEKQSYLCHFLKTVQSKVYELINDYFINESVTRFFNDTMQNPFNESSMLYDTFQQSLFSLVHMCETYLDMPIVPFSVAAVQLKLMLQAITKKISNQGYFPDLAQELSELQQFALARLGISCFTAPCCREGDLSPKQMLVYTPPSSESSKNKHTFLILLQEHFGRLRKQYYNFLGNDKMQKRATFELYLFYSFIQLIMECDEYLDSSSRSEFAEHIYNFKLRLDAAWLNLKNTGKISQDLEQLQKVIAAAGQSLALCIVQQE